MTKIEALAQIRRALQILGENFTDEQALEVSSIYPTWEELCDKKFFAKNKGYRFRYGDDLYKTAKDDFTFQSHWIPSIDTASIFTRIDEAHAGSASDPIPYDGNMELVEGLHYSQNEVVYICTRSSGAPVFHALADLVGLYVEIAESGDSND